jgi:hypothetical protein
MRVNKERRDRYRAELAAAKLEASSALIELTRRLKQGGDLRALARAALRMQYASAALYTAAICIVSPP